MCKSAAPPGNLLCPPWDLEAAFSRTPSAEGRAFQGSPMAQSTLQATGQHAPSTTQGKQRLVWFRFSPGQSSSRSECSPRLGSGTTYPVSRPGSRPAPVGWSVGHTQSSTVARTASQETGARRLPAQTTQAPQAAMRAASRDAPLRLSPQRGTQSLCKTGRRWMRRTAQ